MKIRTSIRAGGSGCSPETQYYMQQAADMQSKVASCVAKGTTASVPPPSGGYTAPYYPPTNTSGYTYPDMSGVCV